MFRMGMGFLLDDGGRPGKLVHADRVGDSAVYLRGIGAAVGMVSEGYVDEGAADGGIDFFIDGATVAGLRVIVSLEPVNHAQQFASG